ncbi:MAG: serine/threonine-protein phosphatase [bacterium]|nr:serine/threonine-protein phosphatase [bacterium]
MLNVYNEEINQLLNKKRLKFPGYLEELFSDDYYINSIKTVRLALVLALVLYISFGIRDHFVSADFVYYTFLIRYAVLCPMILAVLGFSFLPSFKKVMQIVVSSVTVLVGLGTAVMTILDVSHFIGVALLIIVCFTLFKLRLIAACIACLLVIAGYDGAVISFNGIPRSPDAIKTFISNNFFLAASYVIGMFLCYSIELFSRKDFLRRLIIVEKQEELEIEKNRLKERNEIIEKDLLTARNIQQQIIPSTNPNKNIASFFQPMEPIGGDFYDFLKFREPELIGIFLSDVSGHGLSAALITAMLKSIILSSSRYKTDPAALLAHLNDMLTDETDENFITAFYGIYNSETRVLTYSNAGHNPPFIITNGEVERLEVNNGIPLAIFGNEDIPESKKYINLEKTLPAGTKLLLYTDGLTEAARNDDPHYQFEEVIDDVLIKNKSLEPQDFIEELYRELVAYTGKKSFKDDICIVCMDVE